MASTSGRAAASRIRLRVACAQASHATRQHNSCDRRTLLDTVYSAIKITSPTKFKVDNPIRVSKYKTVFEKSYTPNWTMVFTIDKVHHNLSIRGLSRKIHNIAGMFYEYELHRATHSNVPHRECIAQKRKQGIHQVAGIR